MNTYIEGQIRNMITAANMFKKSCQMAAQMDDKNISKEEAKQLKKINAITDRFTKELNEILED